MRNAFLSILITAAVTATAAHSQIKFTTIYDFQGGEDGSSPYGGVVVNNRGEVYGTTNGGGLYHAGTVFQLTPPESGGTWRKTILHHFLSTSATDGTYPWSELVLDSSGALYGATFSGGTTGNGTVFRLSPPATAGDPWTETVLYSFQGGNDGVLPNGSLIVDRDGAVYGTTQYGGGPSNYGTVFKLSPPAIPGGTWKEAILCAFRDTPYDGASPSAGLLMDEKGILYGTTRTGGVIPRGASRGTVFQLVPPKSPGGAWTENILHTFWPDGDNGPKGGLILDSSGRLYGTTADRYPVGGAVFRVTPPTTSGGTWTLTFLHRFHGPDGSSPSATLLLSTTGELFGNTVTGGGPSCNGAFCGTVFKLSPPSQPEAQWIPYIVHRFTGESDGDGPFGNLVFGTTQGFLYGTTDSGGAFGLGTVYQIQR